MRPKRACTDGLYFISKFLVLRFHFPRDVMKKLFSLANDRLIFILITMFLNFLGFSILFPILPFIIEQYVKNANQTAFNTGLLLSIYALCQFISAPGLGALSDRFGRKPILLISLLGSVIGYLILGWGGALWVLFLG